MSDAISRIRRALADEMIEGLLKTGNLDKKDIPWGGGEKISATEVITDLRQMTSRGSEFLRGWILYGVSPRDVMERRFS